MTFKTTKLRDAITFALAVSATAVAGTGVAYAQDADEAEDLDRVVVTGSRIARSADTETAQPVFSLSRQDIESQGLTSVGDVLQNITANGSTLNTTFNNGGNGETRVSLRNLGSARTLVLVNGRRWVAGTGLGGATDLNTIPTAAIERIEVLKDGASVIYGSDAIAGVVNIILRESFDGAEANAYIGAFEQGDGTRQSYDFTAGSEGERWSAMFGISYVKEEPVFAGDRAISAVPVFGSTPGLGGSSTTPNGRFCILDLATFACSQPNGAYGLWTVTGPGTFRGWRGTPDNYNFAPDNYLVTPQERTSLYASGSLDITDNLRFSTMVTYNQRRSEQLLAAMPVVVGVIGVPQASDIVISRDSIYNPYGQDINWIQRRAVETGGRSFKQDVDTFGIRLGLDGSFDIGDKTMFWEAGYFFGENEQNDTTDGLFTYTALRNALGPSMLVGGTPTCVRTPGNAATAIAGCVPLNFLGGAGTITREMLNYVTFQAHDNFGYEQETYYANIQGDIVEMPAGPLAFSFGLERRSESGFDQPDALINAGDTTGNSRAATSGAYDLNEAYLELAIPVLADVPGARLLDFNVATRYSDYSNFGDTTNSKVSLRWKPIDDLLIRANWSEGFRAPSVLDLFQGLSDSFPTLSDPCNNVNFGGLTPAGQAQCIAQGVPAGGYNQVNSQIRITTGGNPNLLPESSVTTTVGFVYSPSYLEGFNVSLDWWRIELEDTIAGFTGQGIANQCYRQGNANACALITRGGGGLIVDLLSAGINFGSTDVEGYDLTLSYAMPETAFGRFSVVWDSTYLANYENNDDGDNLAGEYFDRSNNWRIRSNVSLNWQKGDWSANWLSRYYSGQDEDCTGFNNANRLLLCSDPNRFVTNPVNGLPVRQEQNYMGSAFYNDANVTWAAPWNARITIGVNNIFDRQPPRSASTFANSFDPQYEIPGRFLFLRYNQKF